MRNGIGRLTAFIALGAAFGGPLFAEAPPPGTISVESKAMGPEFDAVLPAFTNAIDDALAAKGFTVLEGAGHAGLVAYYHLVRTDVGSARTRVAAGKASAGPGGAEGVGASVSVPLPTAKFRDVALQQTRLEIVIEKRGENAILWQGAAATVRPAGIGGGKDATVASNLAEVVLRNYPAQSEETVSIP